VIAALLGKISDTELVPTAQKFGITPQQISAIITGISITGSEEETEALLQTERIVRNGGNGNHFESKRAENRG
jgi:hypothetical protein